MPATAITADLVALVKEKQCGPILIRLSWHDAGPSRRPFDLRHVAPPPRRLSHAGVFSTGALKGGSPHAAMRFTDGGEGQFEANAGLDVAIGLLKPISDKYVPGQILNADLWALASNVATKEMGGPHIKARFGRVDAASSKESIEGQEGRLPDGDKGVAHLREIFAPKGFSDREIVALSGAHTVGGCKAPRSGFDGDWTENKQVFDNAYFTDLLTKSYTAETTAAGCPQHRSDAGTIMLISDLDLLEDAAFKAVVEEYAADPALFFKEYASAWTKLQESGAGMLRDEL